MSIVILHGGPLDGNKWHMPVDNPDLRIIRVTGDKGSYCVEVSDYAQDHITTSRYNYLGEVLRRYGPHKEPLVQAVFTELSNR